MSFQLCYSCPILSILTRGTWIILTSKEGGYLLSHQSPLESKIFNNSFHSPQIHQSIHQSPTPTEYSTFKIAPFPYLSWLYFLKHWVQGCPTFRSVVSFTINGLFLTHLSFQATSSFLHTSGKSPCSSNGLPWIFPSGPRQRVYFFTTAASKLRSPFNHGDLGTESWIPAQIAHRTCLTCHAFVHAIP